MEKIAVSSLPKTWIFDFDGTLVEHNGYKIGRDKLLPGVREFLEQIPAEDYVLIVTGREKEAMQKTMAFIQEEHLRCDKILFGMPLGERILFNDRKPSGLAMSHAVNLDRNVGLGNVHVIVDEGL